MNITKTKTARNYKQTINWFMRSIFVQTSIAMILEISRNFVSKQVFNAVISPLLFLTFVVLTLSWVAVLYFFYRDSQFD